MPIRRFGTYEDVFEDGRPCRIFKSTFVLYPNMVEQLMRGEDKPPQLVEPIYSSPAGPEPEDPLDRPVFGYAEEPSEYNGQSLSIEPQPYGPPRVIPQ